MEQVFPTEMGAPSSLSGLGRGKSVVPNQPLIEGVVEKVLGSGNFLIILDDGKRVEVRGSESLKAGSRVRLAPPGKIKSSGTHLAGESLKPERLDGTEWLALIPLGFGGDQASARLEVFIERKKEGLGPGNDLAAYFVITVLTDELGEVQWSIYLKGRQVALQVFGQISEEKKTPLKKLMAGVDEALRKKGFVLLTPAVLLNRTFKAPSGFRLNVRG